MLLLIIILINSIAFVNSTPAFVNVLSSVSWDQNATTVAGQMDGTAGSSNGYLNSVSDISISYDDILFISDWGNNRIVVVNATSLTFIRNIGSGPNNAMNKFDGPNDVFVNGTYIYVVDTNNYRIQKWSVNGTNPSTVPGAGSYDYSYYMYIDKYDNIYVSVESAHKVILFAPNSTVPETVAGTGTSGSQSNRLNTPYGVFVDNNLTLYIADHNNHRVQMWSYGASSGQTVAGTGTSGSSLTQLYNPSGIAVDINGYIYIAEKGNHRIVRWAPNASSGVCIAACSGSYGTNANQLHTPVGFAFDSEGSLYVADANNNRVQRFKILNNQNQITSTSHTTSKPTLKTSQLSSTVQTSLAALTTRKLTSTMLSTSVSHIYTTTMNPTTTFKSSMTSQMSSTYNHVGTSTSSLHSIPLVQITLASTVTLVQTTTINPATTSKSVIISQMSSTDNRMKTSIPSVHSTTGQSILSLIMTLTQTTPMNPTKTSKSVIISQMSSTDNRVKTSISSVHSTTEQSILSSTMTFTQTTSKSIMISQISSTGNRAETSISSVHSTATTTTSKAIITSSIFSTDNHRQTNIFSTKNWPNTSQQILTSSTMKTRTLTNLLSTRITTESSTLWTSIRKISTIVSNIQSSTSTMNTLNCSNAIISLWPNNTSITTPFEIERSQDFSISSTLHLNCAQSFGVIQQWSIEQCLNSLCSFTQQFELSSIQMTLSELFIPSKTLQYGIYQMKLNVKMSISTQLISSAMIYVKIIPSSIQVKLIQYGPSIIIRGQQQILQLNPGTFSINPDESYFNSSNWNYTYFCGIYNVDEFLNLNDTMLSIDSFNSSCFINSTGHAILWKYGSNSSRSSLIIFSGSLSSNHTYHFKVELNNIQNSSIIYIGHLLLQIQDTISMTIIIKCIISTMCISKNEYEMINPTTQIGLTSFCIDNCDNSTSKINIEWNIYYGTSNLTNNFVQWTLFDNKTQYINSWMFGINSNNFTMTTDLLLTYSTIKYWRFEVIYTDGLMKSVGLINFMINSPPTNGSCSIYPLNGTTTTLFTITCSNWFDSDGIKDYSFYTWTIDRSNRLMLGYATSSSFQLRMPINDLNVSSIQIVVRIRDKFDCTTELNLSSIFIVPDMNNIVSLMATIESIMISSDYTRVINSNPFINILYDGNQNDICQVLTSLAQVLNILAQQNLQLAIDNNIPAVSISVSLLNQVYTMLNNESQILNNNSFNFTEYNNQLNIFAAVEEYLIMFINNLTITMIDSVILQGSTLSQLTATTNQLTRNTLIIASTRCLELSRALLNYAQTIPYEDVQTAATSIVQCASNVLTAVNAPLQGRTVILNLDTTRANAFPTDYDTDLESVWSNPNLFANGDDFSQETINKNRNLYYQQQIATIINVQFEETMITITNALNIHLNIEQSISFNTTSVIMSLKKMSNQMIDLNDNTQIWFPQDLHFNSTKNSTISLRCVQTPLPIAGNQAQANINMSNLLLITFVDENGNEMQVHTISEKLIEFFIPRDIHSVIPPMILQNVSSLTNNFLVNNRQFNLHFINITQINTNISISIHFEMHPLNNTLGYMLIYKFDDIPQLNSSINYIDGWAMFCPRNLTNDNMFTYFIDNNKTSHHQTIIFGIRELNSTEFEMGCLNMLDNLLISDRSFNFSANYELRIFTSGCYYLDSNNNWRSDGLLVGSLTNHNRTQCFSSHLSTFASGFLVLPKPINWNYVFANANFLKNKTIYLTVIIIIVIFIIIAIYARHLDNKDNQKLDITVLTDDQRSDKYFYQIVIFTGIWKNAGTSAKVHFILSGDNNETDVRSLTNSHRKILQRGSIDSFIFGVPKSLGLLNYMRIWHDNSGQKSSSSWFLKYVVVRDLQTMEKFYFICQQWLSIKKGDGKIERLLPVSNTDQMREFVYPLTEKAYYSLSDGHLWFSIFSRPPATKFSHVQRCVCCFVLLFTVMLLNILYYDQIKEAKYETRVGGLLLGPFYFTSQQIIIGLIVDIITFIPSTLLVVFFRHIRQYRSSQQISPVLEALSKLRPKQTIQTRTTNNIRISIQKKKIKKKHRILFPWWCLFIAYGLSFLVICVSILLIIARGIEFGDIKIQKWLASLAAAFFSSVLLSQPIKVLCTAIFFALMNHRSIDEDEESDEYIDENEEFHLNGGVEHIQSVDDITHITDRRSVRDHRVSDTKVAEKRRNRLRDIQMWSYIRHLLIYSCYLSLLYIVSFANRNPNAYNEVAHLRNYFLNPNNLTHNYFKISSIDECWQWLEDSFVSNIRAQPWYNGDQPRDLSGFINDKTNRLIGWPVMRQLRIKSDLTCRVPISIRKMIPKCKGDYSLSNEEHQTWFPGWKLTNDNISYSQTIQNAFTYRSGNELESNRYSGIETTYNDGGFVYEFRGRLEEMKSNLTKLHELSWIDSQTRAVLIQLTLYNPNVQLFTSITFLFELISTGGILPQSRFDAIDLHDQFQGLSSIIHGIAGLIYMLIIIYFMYIEIRSLTKLKMKYLRSVWCFIQWGTIICSWAGVGIYIWRFREGSRLSQIFQQTNGYTYVNIHMAVYFDNILMCLFGFCCFFSTINYLYLFRFNSRLSQFAKTLQYVKMELFYFGWTFLIIFTSFLSLFYLLFYSKVLSCSDIYHTAEMLFEMLLLKFDSGDLYQAEFFLGPLAFTLFIYFVVFICCTMIISIINDGFRHIRLSSKSVSKENEDVLLFIFLKMKRAFGIKKTDEVKCEENTSLEHRSPMKQLSDKMDQLEMSLNKLNIISSNESRMTTAPSLTNSDIYVEDVE